MNNHLQMFDFKGRNVRALTIEGEPYFVGKDIAEVLGYSNTRKALADHVDEEDKGVTKCDTLGGKQNLTIINESGMYSLVLSSKLPQAKAFKHWVTCEVLPSLRKKGVVMTNDFAQAMMNGDVNMADLLIIAGEQLKQKELIIKEKEQVIAQKNQQIEELNPKADYTDKVLNAPQLTNISVIAKDYGMSGKAMNQLLHDLGIQYKTGKVWLLYSKYQRMSLTKTKTSRDGWVTMKWTQKGRLFIYNKLKENGILPLMERDENE